MIDRTRLHAAVRVAGFALAGIVAAATPLCALAAPTPAPSPRAQDACSQALAYEQTASRDNVSRQAAYDSAVAGLAANEHCTDAQMHLVNQAYLLSMRAPAEHELHIGDWKRDFDRANALLAQCATYRGLPAKVAADCRTQNANNQKIAAILTTQNATPSPKPSSAASTAPRPAVPLPVPPAPSPKP
ncbi:MAG: hypothetical protein NVS3B7_17460 [Candidatus Elarobacter sp.]